MPMRILQVADTVTGLTCERPYHEARGKDAVISILKNEVDHNRFHRGVVTTFVNNYDDIMAVVAKRTKEITVNWSTLNRQYQTINDNPEPINFSWEFTTVPVNVTGFKPTSCIIIDSTKFPKQQNGEKNIKLQNLENALYGTNGEGTSAGTTARLPLPDEVKSILSGT